MKESVSLVASKAKDAEVLLITEYTTSAIILCNEIEIEQVLVNLIGNSIDAVKNLKEKWVKVALFERDFSVILQVSDSGSGIPINLRDKIFDPFFTTKKTGEGTGLGLSITKGILDKHNASIKIVDDFPNTCFEICFNKTTERMVA